MGPQPTVGESGCKDLSWVHAVLVHGPFDDSPGEINFPLGADSVSSHLCRRTHHSSSLLGNHRSDPVTKERPNLIEVPKGSYEFLY
jgi:hypothetical protein